MAPGVLRSTAQLAGLQLNVTRGGVTPTPFQYTLNGTEQIRVVSYNRAAAVTLDLVWRQWRDSDGSIVVTKVNALGGGFPTPATTDIPLTSGALLNLRLSTQNTTVRYGQLWTQVQIVAGASGAKEILGTLLQGYVTNLNELAWPGSPIQSQHDARGIILDASWSSLVAPLRAEQTVPFGVRWRPISGGVQLTTSGAAGNRFAWLEMIRNGAIVFRGASTRAQAAGEVITYWFGAGLAGLSSVTDGQIMLPFAADIELAGGDIARMSIDNAQAGDFLDVGNGLLVREWMDK